MPAEPTSEAVASPADLELTLTATTTEAPARLEIAASFETDLEDQLVMRILEKLVRIACRFCDAIVSLCLAEGIQHIFIGRTEYKRGISTP